MKKSLTILLLILMMLFIPSCSFFEEEAQGVNDITFSINDNNDIVITVSYYDENQTVKEQIVPAGVDGKDGISVDINVIREEEAKRNKVVLTFSDGTEKYFYVPDGVRIKDITSEYNEELNKTFMYLVYSNDEVSDGIEIPQGEKGVGIDTAASSAIPNDEDGSIDIILTFTDGTVQTFNIPKGETGNGIDYIEPIESEGQFTLEITYTNGDVRQISFTRPILWYQGNGGPTEGENYNTTANSRPGDYYLDVENRKIYRNTLLGWEIAVDFSQVIDKFTVKFDLNDDEDSPATLNGNPRISNLAFGTYLIGRIPIPTRTGFEFLGWATSTNITPTTGFFTELTPVTQDLTLYAIWKEIE